eukprot:scaffold8602_cov277-Pinguiococcus_pyrenoidosus.AAC.6
MLCPPPLHASDVRKNALIWLLDIVLMAIEPNFCAWVVQAFGPSRLDLQEIDKGLFLAQKEQLLLPIGGERGTSQPFPLRFPFRWLSVGNGDRER